MAKPWKEWNFDELADEAQTGTRGQGAVVESTRRLIVATQVFSTESAKQAATMIRLTRWIIALTIALGLVAILQLIAMLWPKGGA